MDGGWRCSANEWPGGRMKGAVMVLGGGGALSTPNL